jgi:hypothetical protein
LARQVEEAAQAERVAQDEAMRDAPSLPDLGVLFSDLGLREVPAAERGPVAPPEVEAADDDDVVDILDEDDQGD